MGGGASVPEEPIDATTARSLLGDQFDEARFDKMKDKTTDTISPEQARNFLAEQMKSDQNVPKLDGDSLPIGSPMEADKTLLPQEDSQNDIVDKPENKTKTIEKASEIANCGEAVANDTGRNADLESYIDTALCLTESEKVEAARATLAAAEAREKALKKELVLDEKKNDYSKSFSGSKADTVKEKDFGKLLSGDDDGDDHAKHEDVDPALFPVVDSESSSRYSELRASGQWLKLLSARGMWIWVHSLTHETVAMRPQDFEEEGAAVEKKVFDPAGGFASCAMPDLMEELEKCFEEDHKTPLLIDGSHDKNITLFFEIKGMVADLSNLGIPKVQQRRKKIKPKDEMEKIRQQAVKAIKAGATLCLNLGDFNGQDSSFTQGLCKRDVFPVEIFEDAGRKLLTPSNDPRCGAMFRSEDKEGGIVTWKEKFRLVVVSALTVTDFKSELWASGALPNDYLKPIYVTSD